MDELDNGCMRVITSSSHFRTDMKAIQAEPGDKSYVDKWLAEQLVKLENQEPGNTFGTLLNILRHDWKYCFCGFILLVYSVLSYQTQTPQTMDPIVIDSLPNYGSVDVIVD